MLSNQKSMFRLRPLLRAGFLSGVLLVAGCQTDLYSGLTEVEANQMLAVLVANGIPTDKAAAGKEGFSLRVDERDMLRAIAVLKDHGYPRNTRESIGKVFQKSGIMSSPFEERVRYIYALGEEVAQTLSSIDGVITARVHIVLPDTPQLGQPVRPSSAAVFIKHQPGIDIDFLVPQIRRLVSSSIEGLEYSAVTVVLTEARPTRSVATTENGGTVEVLPGLAIRDTDQKRFWTIGLAVAALIVLLLAANLATFLTFRGKRAKRPADGSAGALVEPS